MNLQSAADIVRWTFATETPLAREPGRLIGRPKRAVVDPHRDAATDPWRAHKPRPDRSRPSCRRRRACAIAFPWEGVVRRHDPERSLGRRSESRGRARLRVGCDRQLGLPLATKRTDVRSLWTRCCTRLKLPRRSRDRSAPEAATSPALVAWLRYACTGHGRLVTAFSDDRHRDEAPEWPLSRLQLRVVRLAPAASRRRI